MKEAKCKCLLNNELFSAYVLDRQGQFWKKLVESVTENYSFDMKCLYHQVTFSNYVKSKYLLFVT